MKVDLGIWGKLTKVVVLLLFLAGVLGLAVCYLPLIQKNERWRKELLRKETQIAQEELASKQYKAAIDALLHDPKAVERLAREQLRYAKPGETIFIFEDPATNQSPMISR